MVLKESSHYARRSVLIALKVLILLQVQSGICQTVEEKYADLPTTVKAKVDTMDKCSFYLKDPSIKDLIRDYTDHVTLINMDIHMEDDNGLYGANKKDQDALSIPLEQFLVLDGSGKFLLMLKEYFILMSKYTLGQTVASVAVNITSEPRTCLELATNEDIDRATKTFILENFISLELPAGKGLKICSKYITIDNVDVGSIRYVCCKLDLRNSLICEGLGKSIWLDSLFKLSLLAQILFVIYSPLFVFRQGSAKSFLDFVHRPLGTLALNVAVAESSVEIKNTNFIKVKQGQFVNLKKGLCHLKPGRQYLLFIRQIYLRLQANKIVPDGDSPVSFKKYIKRIFFQCQMQREVSSAGGCCHENLFKMVPCCDVPWYRCLSVLLQLLIVVLLTVPWIVRVWFYYTFEEEALENSSRLFESKGLHSPAPDSLVSYLTPFHWVFKTIYCVIPLAAIVYFVLPRSLKRQSKFIIQTCFKKTRETKKLDSSGKFIVNMLWPLKEFGIVGFLVCPLWLFVLPLECIILSYQIFPIFSLSVRLLVNLIYYILKITCPNFCFYKRNVLGNFFRWVRNKSEDIIVIDKYEEDNRRNNILRVVAVVMCTITILSVLTLITECVSFYMECVIYAIIGIILNLGKIVKFLVLLLFLMYYCYDSFSRVSSRYRNLGHFLNKEVQARVGNILQEAVARSNETTNNKAFRVVPYRHDSNHERIILSADKKGRLKWRTQGLLFFLNERYNSYIPKDFCLQFTNLTHYLCPGPMYVLYFWALVEFTCIALFLLFVLFDILAFGEANNISTIHLSLVSVIGGFVPLIVRKYLLKIHTKPYLYNETAIWGRIISDVINGYIRHWKVEDLEVRTCAPIECTNYTGEGQFQNKSTDLMYNSENASLEYQISDFHQGRLKPLNTNAAIDNIRFFKNLTSAVSDDIDMIIITHGETPLEDEQFDIYVREGRIIKTIAEGTSRDTKPDGITEV